jgi:DNA repair protein RadC
MHQGLVYTIKDLPLDERPRERLMKYGSASLSEAELLAIILRVGTVQENVIDLSKRILREHSLRDICQLGINELKKFRGINDAKACQVLACAELASRIYASQAQQKARIDSSKDVYELIYPELRFTKKEQFYCLYLDTRNNLIRKELVSVGNLNTSVIHPREIFRSAIKESANSVILCHNHPSGNAEPSKDDLEITKLLVSAGKLMGIQVLDHVVIGDGGHVSMADRGLVKF